MTKRLFGLTIAMAGIAIMANAAPASAGTLVYDNFEKAGGYTLADYQAKWNNPYGLGEMGVSDTRNFTGGSFNLSATPFKTAFDFSVFDHIKYLGISNDSFAVPTGGAITFSSTITGNTTGTQDGRIINGTYIQGGAAYSAPTLAGQQAAAVMNMIDFQTGQLFDWFISGNQAFTLIERLPSAVTNPAILPGDPNFVGIDKAYTQIIDVMTIGAGPQNVSITYNDNGSVDYLLNGVIVSHVDNVGIPLDKQGVPYEGIYPSYGPGEALAGKIKSLSIGTGLFSLLDAFPFQLPDRPDLAVSVPVSERIFGQGISASFDNITVTAPNIAAVPEPATWAMMITGFGAVAGSMRVARRKRSAMIAA